MPAPILVDSLKALSHEQIEEALSLPAGALISADIGPQIHKWEAGRSVKAQAGKFASALHAGADLTIDLLNSDSDREHDATGVFGKAKSDKDYGIEPSPRLHANKKVGWLKYAFSGKVRVETATELGLASFSAEASRGIEYTSYRPHALSDRIAAAVSKDLGQMPTVLEVNDVAELATGEAVSVRIPGRVGFQLDLDESFLSSASLQPLADAFGLAAPVTLEFKKGFSFTASLSFQDEMRLVFVGLEDGWVHASLRKARTSSQTVQAGWALGAGIDANSQQTVVDELTEALFGAAVSQIDSLIQQLNFAALTPQQQALLERLGLKLGETRSGDALLGSVKERLAGWKQKFSDAVETLVKTRLEIGFKFEYERVATDGSLFEAELSAKAVHALHKDLLAFDLNSVIGMARQQEANGLRDFYLLHETSVTRRQSFGFTLGVGKWLKISASSSGIRRIVEQVNVRNEKRLFWISTRKVAGAFNESESGTTMSFRADTEDFLDHPTMAHLKLSMSLDSIQNSVKPKHLAQLMDLAALWRVFQPAQLQDQLAQATGFLGSTKRFDSTLSLRASDRLVRSLATWISAGDNAACAPLLARSLPYWAGHQAREVEALREEVYTPVFRDYLMGEGDQPHLENMLKRRLESNHPKLATAEKQNLTASVSFLGYATLGLLGDDTKLKKSWERRPIGTRLDHLRLACAQLITLPSRSASEMDQILGLLYDKQKSFAERSFTTRFFGALLAQIAIDSAYEEGWAASLSLSVGEGKERRTLVVGRAEAAFGSRSS